MGRVSKEYRWIESKVDTKPQKLDGCSKLRVRKNIFKWNNRQQHKTTSFTNPSPTICNYFSLALYYT